MAGAAARFIDRLVVRAGRRILIQGVGQKPVDVMPVALRRLPVGDFEIGQIGSYTERSFRLALSSTAEVRMAASGMTGRPRLGLQLGREGPRSSIGWLSLLRRCHSRTGAGKSWICLWNS